jgi:tight adherence protein C
MFLAVTASAVFAYCFFLTLFSPVLKDLQKVGLRLERLDLKEKEIGGEEMSKPFTERIITPLFSKLLKSVTKMSRQKNTGSGTKLDKELRLAGIFMSAGDFSALRRVLLFFCLGLSVIILLIPSVSLEIKLLIFLFALILAVLVPRYYLKAKIKKRQNEIRRQMPDVMDLLSVSVEAGLGFDAALLRVGERSKGALIDELLSVHREIQMGKSRRNAFKSLSDRSSVEELKTFAGAMVQADQLGISIKNVLRLQAQQLRLKRRQTAEEKAMKAPVKMMLPLVIFIFPVIFIILLGPSAVTIIKVLGG